MKESRAYGDVKMYSPDGKLMFLTGGAKLDFYIRNGLAEPIGDKAYRLTFVPKGYGHSERNTALLEPRANKCVVCGTEDMNVLTRHHVIPSRFWRHFPKYIKSNNSRYVVMACRKCHDDYGHEENILNDVLAKEYGIKTLKECNDEIYVERRVLASIANALLHCDSIPVEKQNDLMNKFVYKTNMAPNEENLRKALDWKFESRTERNDFGKLIVDKVKNLYEFQQRWLEHFVYHMQPKHLPEDLRILLKNP